MLGKRPRPPMKRTTSMSLIGSGSAHDQPHPGEHFYDTRAVSQGLSPISMTSTVEPAHFLEACHLCKRRLGDGQDIYMYRGDTAFCSVECRQQQMAMDERKEKSIKKVPPASSANHHDNSSSFQARPGTVAAA